MALINVLKRLHGLADRIYARDGVSYEHLKGLVGQSTKICRGPDFTGLVDGIKPTDAIRFAGKIAVIPNQRMLDKTTKDVADGYFGMLVAFVQQCQALGKEVFVLNHEGQADQIICDKLCRAFEPPLPYTGVRTAKEVKGIIGGSSGVMTSRFHGLVSALMQGVPALATSWSHKYEEFLRSYEAEKYLLNLNCSNESLLAICRDWMEKALPVESTMRSQYKNRACLIKNDIRTLWDDVENLILRQS